MDPERLVQCPYDKNHQIRASRFPYHLVKCKENNGKIARKLATCPYNARHRIPKEEFNSHLENCENKIALDVSNGKKISIPIFQPNKYILNIQMVIK
uniref:CHHC U11-48K-type domain-containing protein n=1 Tax=Laticauda laticaudata TaxID=8630 RepID=A0A8C5S538_LATLA